MTGREETLLLQVFGMTGQRGRKSCACDGRRIGKRAECGREWGESGMAYVLATTDRENRAQHSQTTLWGVMAGGSPDRKIGH